MTHDALLHTYTDVPHSEAGSVCLHPRPAGCDRADSRTWGQDLTFPLSVSFFFDQHYLPCSQEALAQIAIVLALLWHVSN